MAKFRKRPVVIEAQQWEFNGSLTWDNSQPISPDDPRLSEGECVRYFRHPNISGDVDCHYCQTPMHVHGWIETLEGGHFVCPLDWIIKSVGGAFHPCRPEIFAATYEPVDEETG